MYLCTSHSISHHVFITLTLDQSIKNQLIELPINQSINQLVNQSISVAGHQPILHLSNLFHDPLVTWWLLHLCELHFLHLCGVSGHWTLWNKKGGCRDGISYCDNLIQDSPGQKFVNILKFWYTHSWPAKVCKLLWLPEVQEILVKTLFVFYWKQNSPILMWFSAKWVFAWYVLHSQRGCGVRSFNSLIPGKFEENFGISNFSANFGHWWLRYLFWNCPLMNVTVHNWW